MSTALANFKRAHGVATHRLAGAGHRYAWMAFFATIQLKDGTRRGFSDLVAEYSMAALEARNKVADGVTEIEACQFLAERNGIPWPVVEILRGLKPADSENTNVRHLQSPVG